jgi:4a-hydroxytetrahydrobiopterin dehydratase
MERRILTPDELSESVAGLKDWAVNGKMLEKKLKFENFAQALEYVNRVGALAEAADHHPDIKLGWGYAEISLTTHDRGGVTDVDLKMARSIDNIQT